MSHRRLRWYSRPGPGRAGRLIAAWGILLGSLLTCALNARAEDEEPVSAAPTLRVGALHGTVEVDGRLTERAWEEAPDSIADLVTVEPKEGAVPNGRTIVKVLADHEAVLIGVRCFDDAPDKIVAYSKGRDADLTEEDNLVIVLDTFLDGRSGHVFEMNPAGARFDGLVSNRGEDVNSEWDAIWEGRTTRDATGWTAEIRIPVASLTFKKGLDRWGFNVQRHVQRLQETSRWSATKIDYEIFQTSHAGRITELPAFDLGVGLSARPSFVGNALKPGPGLGVTTNEDLSLDVTQELGGDLRLAATMNTDFSETEVDVRQVNLSRFPISFPEKRTFFLAGADIFEFGLGLDEESVIPVFTRRIGLVGAEEDDQTEVSIDGGGKVTGRVGNASVGALVVNTRSAKHVPYGAGLVDVPDATMGVFRVKQDVLDESAIGVLGTFGDQLGRRKAWTAGLDFTYQTSSFQEDKNFLAGVWGMLNDRENLHGDKSAYGVMLDYPNDLWDISLAGMHLGAGFDPSLGFVPRNDVRLVALDALLSPRVGKAGFHQTFHQVTLTGYTNARTGRWETYQFELQPLGVLFDSGDRIEAAVFWDGDRPPLEFEVAPDVDIAPGSYEWSRQSLTLRTAAKRRIAGEISGERGGFYTGRVKTVRAQVTFRASALLTLEITGERNQGDVMAPENESIQLFNKAFRQDLIGGRFELNVSPDLQLSSLTQYDTESREFGSNTRLRWTFAPRGELFLVYDHAETRALNNHWNFASSQTPLKLQYAWRF